MSVYSPKTERHPGKERRTVPIAPKLMTILQDAFDAAETGQERVITPMALPWVFAPVGA